MSIRFKCPQCGKALKFSDSAVGKKGRCPSCKTPVTIQTEIIEPPTSLPVIAKAERLIPKPIEKPFAVSIPMPVGSELWQESERQAYRLCVSQGNHDGAMQIIERAVIRIKTTQLAEAKQKERNEIPCPFCGEYILEAARKCKHCGEFLHERERPSAPVVVHQQPAYQPPQPPSVQVVVKQSMVQKSTGMGCLGLFVTIVILWIIIAALSR